VLSHTASSGQRGVHLAFGLILRGKIRGVLSIPSNLVLSISIDGILNWTVPRTVRSHPDSLELGAWSFNGKMLLEGLFSVATHHEPCLRLPQNDIALCLGDGLLGQGGILRDYHPRCGSIARPKPTRNNVCHITYSTCVQREVRHTAEGGEGIWGGKADLKRLRPTW
jgi:hypothetical protein